MTPHYGFELIGGSVIEVDAGTINEAIVEAERQTGRRVQRGRCLDGYTPDGFRSDLAQAEMFAEIRARDEADAFILP